METKFTTSGKKVAVLGKLNNEQWIVQEIFVANGQEFPAGENFVERTLLDAPAETYTSRKAKQLESEVLALESKIKKLKDEYGVIERNDSAAKLINRFTQHYQNIDVSEIKTLIDFITGKITHLVVIGYDEYEIIDIVESLKKEDKSRSWIQFEGLKLISLFGCCENGNTDKYDEKDKYKGYKLNWKINRYCDGSGDNKNIIPCNSYESAIAVLDEVFLEKNVSLSLLEAKEKYGTKNPPKEKIRKFYREQAESKKKYIYSEQQRIEKIKEELNRLCLLSESA